MKTLLIRCYPAAWRERYGDEFAAILEERPLGPFDVADILLGALDARLRMRNRRAGLTERKGFSMSLRIGGIAAILGAVTLAVAWFLGYGFVAVDGTAFAWPPVARSAWASCSWRSRASPRSRHAVHPVLSWAAFGLLMVGTIIADHRVRSVRALGRDGFWNLGALGFLDGARRDDAVRDRDLSDRGPVARRGGPARRRVGPAVRCDGRRASIVVLVAAMVCFLLGWFAARYPGDPTGQSRDRSTTCLTRDLPQVSVAAVAAASGSSGSRPWSARSRSIRAASDGWVESSPARRSLPGLTGLRNHRCCVPRFAPSSVSWSFASEASARSSACGIARELDRRGVGQELALAAGGRLDQCREQRREDAQQARPRSAGRDRPGGPSRGSPAALLPLLFQMKTPCFQPSITSRRKPSVTRATSPTRTATYSA